MGEKMSMDALFEKAVKREKSMLKRELKRAKISEHKMKVLDTVLTNVSVMKVKLDEAKASIATEPSVVEYDNGGGQKGVRENPFFTSYEKLWAAYMKGMDRIMSSLPDDKVVAEEVGVDRPETVLDIIETRRRKDA